MRRRRRIRPARSPKVDMLALWGAILALVVVLFIRFAVMGSPRVEATLSALFGPPSQSSQTSPPPRNTPPGKKKAPPAKKKARQATTAPTSPCKLPQHK